MSGRGRAVSLVLTFSSNLFEANRKREKQEGSMFNWLYELMQTPEEVCENYGHVEGM